MQENPYLAWQKPIHAVVFDSKWASLTREELKNKFDGYDEIKLLSRYLHKTEKGLLDLGCATGEMYRYLNEFYPNVEYTGYDISTPAISLAKEKFCNGDFRLTSPNLQEIFDAKLEIGMLYSKDVLLHQTEPYRFLDRLLALGARELILKFRTHDRGRTESDYLKSRQKWYGEWIPYIVLNYYEFLGYLKAHGGVEYVHTIRDYKPLYGLNGRELPAELASPSSGTASTSVYLRLGTNKKRVRFHEAAHGKRLSATATKFLLAKSKLRRNFL